MSIVGVYCLPRCDGLAISPSTARIRQVRYRLYITATGTALLPHHCCRMSLILRGVGVGVARCLTYMPNQASFQKPSIAASAELPQASWSELAKTTTGRPR